MLKLNFKIDKKYLAAHAIKKFWMNFESPFSNWNKFVYKLRKNHPDVIDFLTDPSLVIVGNDLDNARKETEKVLKKILKTKEFKRLYNETDKYKNKVNKEWNKNKKEALSIVEELSGLKIPSKEIDVYITHPNLRNGRAVPRKNIILWGYKDKFKNYSTVYLCHELLHLLTQKAVDQNIIHVLITFISDKELRNKLNKEKIALKEDIPKIAPPFIQEQLKLNNKIVPYWKEYKKKQSFKDIFELEKYLIKKIAE